MHTDAYDFVLIDPCDIPFFDDGWSELYGPSDFLKEQQKALDWFAIPVVATLYNQVDHLYH